MAIIFTKQEVTNERIKMLRYEDYKTKIRSISTACEDRKKFSFFMKHFNKFSRKDKSIILSVFENSNFIKDNPMGRWNLFLKKNPDVAKIILEESQDCLNSFLEEDDTGRSVEQLKFVEVFFDIESYVNNNLDENLMVKTLDKIYTIQSKDKTIIENGDVHKIISYFITYITKKHTNKEFMMKMKNSISYKQLETLVCDYIETLDATSLYDNKFLEFIIETHDAVDSETISSKIKNKFSERIELNNYDINNMTEAEKVDYYNKIVIYRMQKGIIPKNICIELLKGKCNNLMTRMANIDYIKSYLYENDIRNTTVFLDEQLPIEGQAIANSQVGPVCIQLNNHELDITSFHEATHAIQYNDMFVLKKYRGNRYSMLKDFLIAHRAIDYNTYRNNYPSLLFEEEAEHEGCRLYYQYLKDTNSSRKNKENIEEGIVRYSGKIDVLDTIEINGEEKNKVQMFDELLRKEPSIIEQYPILQIEYNFDGTKKSLSQIMHSLELKCLTDKDEDEVSSIANCILEDIQEISEFEYNELSEYTSKSTFISNVIEQFLNRISIVKNKNLTLKLGIESGSIETPYIDQTYETIESQDIALEPRECDDT